MRLLPALDTTKRTGRPGLGRLHERAKRIRRSGSVRARWLLTLRGRWRLADTANSGLAEQKPWAADALFAAMLDFGCRKSRGGRVSHVSRLRTTGDAMRCRIRPYSDL